MVVRPLCSQLEDRTAPALFTVGTPQTITSTDNYGCIATGDFNGDGNTDMVLTNYGTAAPGNDAAGNTIRIAMGNGNGTFASASTITISGANPQYVSFVAVGDVNKDSKLDLAVVSNNEDSTGMLRIYLGNGSGGFTLSTQGAISAGCSNVSWVVIGQVTNGDTNPDIVLCGFGDSDEGQTTVFGNNIGVFQGDGTGAFSSINTLTNGLAFIPTSVEIGDFDGDNDTDIAATVPGVPPDTVEPQPAGTVQLFSGNGSGGFDISTSFSSGGALPYGLKVAYLNADTLPDLVITNAGDPDVDGFYLNFGLNSNIGIGINTDDMNFNVSTLSSGLGVGGSKSVFHALAADFDGDSKQDIAAIVYGNPLSGANARILAFKGDGNGGFAADANSPYNTLTTDGQYLAVAPLDAGSTPDIVYCTAGGKYGVLTNTSTGGAPTVTINQAAGQADPTNVASVQFDVVFSAAVTGFDSPSDIDLSSSTGGGAGLSASITSTDASHYKVTVTGMTGTGTVRATIPAGAATATTGGQTSGASTSTDNQITYDLVAPTVTINQASGQPDPTTGSPVQFTVVFSENVSGFTGSDISFAGSTVGGTLVANVTGSGSNYTVNVTGMSGTGTVVASIPANAAADSAGNQTAASTSTDNTVMFGNGPTVTINQGSGQADPTNVSPITFDVHFSQPVTGFDGSDISFAGSTVGGTLVANVSPLAGGQDYTVTVTGMSGAGTVVASIPANVAINGSSIGNAGSTSTDNTVTFDGVVPTVTINQAVGQIDPTTVASIKFDVKFSKNVTGFTGSDVSFTGSTAGGTLVATVTGSLDTYQVTVTGMTTGGDVVVSIPAGVAVDGIGNANLASTSTDNSVRFMNTGVLGFKLGRYDTTENATDNTVEIIVSRTGAADGAVTIDYSTADVVLGAHSGGLASRGQDDYTPTNGTLNWADGEMGDKSFFITILPDSLNEGLENISLTLSNMTGLATLGLTSAVAAIAPSDGQGPGKYLDQDNDKYSIVLGGKTGTLEYFRTDPDGDSKGPIELIKLNNTLPDPLRPRATLTVTVTPPKFGSDKFVGIGAITGPGLRSITARRSDLTGAGVLLDGYLNSLTINNILNGADIITGGTANPLQKVRIRAGNIGDGTDINVGTGLSSLTALSFGAGSLTAWNVGVISVKGNWAADMSIAGIGVVPGRNVLGTMRVRGVVSATDIMVNGNVGTVAVGAFRSSRLFASYTGPDQADPSGFATVPARISSFRSTGLIAGFQNSHVIADTIKSVRITNLVSANPTEFGFYANTLIGSVRVAGPLKWAYDVEIQGPQGFDNFVTTVV